jgi:hypothetical protein
VRPTEEDRSRVVTSVHSRPYLLVEEDLKLRNDFTLLLKARHCVVTSAIEGFNWRVALFMLDNVFDPWLFRLILLLGLVAKGEIPWAGGCRQVDCGSLKDSFYSVGRSPSRMY